MSNYFAIAKKHQFACLPLQNNSKKPATKNGCTDATTDLASLSSWAGNIGIEAQRSNLILIDLDNKDGRDGYSKWKEYQKQHGRTSTLAATTPSGGIHLYYRRPKGFDALKLQNVKDHPAIGAGIEIRHTNQYLVAPPSVIDGKCYEWIEPEAEIAECPQWVITMMTEATIGPVKTGWDKITLPTGYQYSAKDIIEKYNSSHKIEDVLTAHGYVTAKDGWMRYPGENTPSVHIIGENKSYHFGAGDPLQGKGYGTDKCCIFPFDVVVHLDYSSDYKKAVREISVSLSMDGKSRKVDTNLSPTNESPKASKLLPFYQKSELKNVKWLWKHHIPLGCLTLIAGEQGHGKSTMIYDLIARLSTGRPMPDGQLATTCKTLIISCEDNPEDSAGPKLEVAGANWENIVRWPGIFTMADLPELEQTLLENPDIKLFMIEPIYEIVKGDTNGVTNVTAPLEALQKMAWRTGVSGIGVHHFGKSKADNANQKTLGSIGFTSKPRACWGVLLKKDDPTIHILAAGKRNVKLSDNALQFRIEDTVLEANGEVIETVKVVWLDERLEATNLDSLLQQSSGVMSPQAATDWLEKYLKEAGETDSDIIKREGEDAGFSHMSLWRAKDKLNAKATKYGVGAGGRWTWKLPTDETENTKPRIVSERDEDPYSGGKAF